MGAAGACACDCNVVQSSQYTDELNIAPKRKHFVEVSDVYDWCLPMTHLPLPSYRGFKLLRHDIKLGESPRKHRVYLVYDPILHKKGEEFRRLQRGEEQKDQSDRKDKHRACIFLFHGTNESCFDTEFFTQSDGRQSWLDLAHARDVLLVFCSAQCARRRPRDHPDGFRDDGFRSVWVPGELDLEYAAFVKEHVVKDYKLDCELYAVGKSNGGMAVCNFVLEDPLLFDAACSWVGGVPTRALQERQVLPQELWKLPDRDERRVQGKHVGMWGLYRWFLHVAAEGSPRLVLLTGTRDDNRSPTYRAWRLLMTLGGVSLRVEDFMQGPHRYSGDFTKHIFQCLSDFTSFHSLQPDELHTY